MINRRTCTFLCYSVLVADPKCNGFNRIGVRLIYALYLLFIVSWLTLYCFWYMLFKGTYCKCIRTFGSPKARASDRVPLVCIPLFPLLMSPPFLTICYERERGNRCSSITNVVTFNLHFSTALLIDSTHSNHLNTKTLKISMTGLEQSTRSPFSIPDGCYG